MSKREKDPIHILVVDDSATARELLIGLFQSSPDLQVVGAGSNGLDAITLVNTLHPDVVAMDINMPRMDGFEATKRIMREMPTPIVLITGSRMSQDIDLAFKALRAGALTVIHKPGLNDPDTCCKFVQTVRLMADVPVIHHWRTNEASIQSSQSPVNRGRFEPFDSSLNGRMTDIDVIGIAASTGGPSALVTVLSELPKDFPLPILVVQHITPGFTDGLADWLSQQIRLAVGIATHGEKLQPGALLLAPDDYHLQVGARGIIELSKVSPYKGLRPSANYLFNSLAQAYGRHAMGIVLTGMGDDGAKGAAALYNAGGFMIAQDEQSSVVYGMPREVMVRNTVHHVLGLEQIAVLLNHFTHSADSSA
jgi:two-component system chemotaxis response regulator CheB